ncbi:putative sentrin-specific protease-like, partial [Triplophysa rosa]
TTTTGQLWAFMRQKGCNFSRWSCDTLPHPKQQDGTSCGVFALKFAECVLREETIVFRNTPEGVEELRKAIAVTLLQNSVFKSSEKCGFCLCVFAKFQIACDCCSRWYHQSCVQWTSKVNFLCPACEN